MTTNHFERLGLPSRFSVDLAQLEREYLARSRAAHPDLHPPETRDQAQEEMAALNEAYITLKEPFRRAEYLVKLHGGPTADEEKNLDQMFLMEMMDLREQIEEARSTPGRQSELMTIQNELELKWNTTLAKVADALEKYQSDPNRQHLATARRALNAAKTVRSLLREF